MCKIVNMYNIIFKNKSRLYNMHGRVMICTVACDKLLKTMVSNMVNVFLLLEYIRAAILWD